MAKTRTLIAAFSQHNAQAMALALLRSEHIDATAEHELVDGKPTGQWHLYVPSTSRRFVVAWLKGWMSGCKFGRIDMKATLSGERFEDMARKTGYPELIGSEAV